MSKKHFQAFAKEIAFLYTLNKEHYGQETARLIRSHQIDLIKIIASQFNPLFNREKFELACLPQNENI